MALRDSALLDRLKSSLLGDMTPFDRGHFQSSLSAALQTPAENRMRHGRTYGLLDAPKTAPRSGGRAFRLVTGVWSKVRGIGEYDAARTR